MLGHFTPASSEAARRALSPPSAVAVASVLVFLVVILEGDPLLFVSFAIIFRVFRPKIACQVPKPSKSHKQNKIELAF
jgi:hypothetical protein